MYSYTSIINGISSLIPVLRPTTIPATKPHTENTMTIAVIIAIILTDILPFFFSLTIAVGSSAKISFNLSSKLHLFADMQSLANHVFL
ncbi:MAG: hypothetical protein HDT32_00435 [Clostridiales bacterium]|nr:hypothetical protein [Clostridiales bacterium]